MPRSNKEIDYYRSINVEENKTNILKILMPKNNFNRTSMFFIQAQVKHHPYLIDY